MLTALGLSTDTCIIVLLGFCVILLIFLIMNGMRIRMLKRKYDSFMRGANGVALEKKFEERFDELDRQIDAETSGNAKWQKLDEFYAHTFQKVGLVKYDAFDEMGGQLSFSLALLNGNEDGFILNAMHSREGCYTYIKEVIDGNAYVLLSDEEREALDKALDYNL